MRRHRILFIVRHRSVLKQLLPGLEKHYDVVVTQTRRDAMAVFVDGNVDLLLIDVSSIRFDLPRFCRDLRELEPGIFLFFLLNKGVRLDQLPPTNGYLRSPFSARQLLGRLARVFPDHVGDIVTWRTLRLDTETCILMWSTKQVTLTPKQAALAQVFLHSPGVVLSRAKLMQDVWGTDYLGDTRTLDVHIHWLRKSLVRLAAPFMIKTERGKGYALIDATTEEE